MPSVLPIMAREDIEAIEKVLKSQSARNYIMFFLGIHVGLRISDLLNLKVKDVKDRTHIYVREQKTKKEKRVLMQPEVKRILNKYVQAMEPEEYLFKSRQGYKSGTKIKPISREQAYRIIKKAAKECGISEIGTHTLRKTFGYHMFRTLQDEKKSDPGVAVMNALNHSKLEHTLRYIGITQQEEDQARRSIKYKNW